jgi:hypothetical protein
MKKAGYEKKKAWQDDARIIPADRQFLKKTR